MKVSKTRRHPRLDRLRATMQWKYVPIPKSSTPPPQTVKPNIRSQGVEVRLNFSQTTSPKEHFCKIVLVKITPTETKLTTTKLGIRCLTINMASNLEDWEDQIYIFSVDCRNQLHCLWNPKVQCGYHKGSPIIPILSQIDPISRIDTYFFKINFNIFPPS